MGSIRPAGDQFQWGYYESEPLTQLDLALGDVFEPSIPPSIASPASIYGTSCYPNLDPRGGPLRGQAVWKRHEIEVSGRIPR